MLLVEDFGTGLTWECEGAGFVVCVCVCVCGHHVVISKENERKAVFRTVSLFCEGIFVI